MADVTISYNNADIVEISDNDEIILDTAGKSMADDITVKYVKSVPQMQAKSVSPTVSTQTVTPDSGYDGLSSVSVLPIYPRKIAQTYTPTTTNQTISSGQWLQGVQTILGDSNLVAANIKKDVSIFGVTGTYEGGGGGTTTITALTDVMGDTEYIDANGAAANNKGIALNDSLVVLSKSLIAIHTPIPLEPQPGEVYIQNATYVRTYTISGRPGSYIYYFQAD